MTVPWKVDDTQPDAVPWKVDDTTAPQPDAMDTARRGVGRVLVNAIASPAVLAARGWSKLNPNVPMADLQPYVDKATDWIAPPPQDKGSQFIESIAKVAPAFAIPATLPAQVAGNAAIGAVEAQKGEEVKGGATGAAFGAGGHALAKLVGGLITPTKDAKVLMDKGVALTPGQAAGANSGWNRFEQSMSSNPIAAPFIRPAQRRGVEEANIAAAKSVANIVEKDIKLGLPPSEAIAKTREAIGNAYNESLDGLVAYKGGVEEALVNRAAGVVADHPMLDPKDAAKIENYVLTRFENVPDLPSGADWKKLDSEIGGYVRNLFASSSASDKVAAAAWRDIHLALRESIESVMQRGKAEQLGQANTAYRQLLALEKARGPNESITPRRLRQTLEKMGIKGTELNKISGAMDTTLPNVVNDSGTAERLITNALPSLLMGGGAAAQGFGLDTVGTGLIAAGALGSRPGARFMTGGLPGQAMMSEALRRTVPAAGHAVTRKDKK